MCKHPYKITPWTNHFLFAFSHLIRNIIVLQAQQRAINRSRLCTCNCFTKKRKQEIAKRMKKVACEKENKLRKIRMKKNEKLRGENSKYIREVPFASDLITRSRLWCHAFIISG